MPRKRKTNLPAVPYPGAQYGQGQDQVAALKQIPLPNQVNAQQNALDQAASQGPGGQQAPPQGPPPFNWQAAMEAAQQEPPGSAIDQAGNQPFTTAGMAIGPGPGPEAVMPPPNSGNLFQTLAATTGDANFLRLGMMTRSNQ